MDLYQELGKAIQDIIIGEWEKVTINIESSLNRMCEFESQYITSTGEDEDLIFPFPVFSKLTKGIYELQESMLPEHKWNRAVYTLERDGQFNMEFEWDQALQDEWDNP